MKNKKLIISVILVVVVFSVACAFYTKADKQEIKIPQSQEEMFEFVDSDEFKAMDERTQKEAIGKAMEQHWNRVVDEYFAADEKGRDAYLDEVIEEMAQTKKKWIERKKQEGELKDKPEDAEAQQKPKKALSAENLREKAESVDPVRLARMSEFKKAIMERMGERGKR